MRTDQKEMSEHLMLVDLARNDPGAHLYAGQPLRS
ncbi:Anthranilate synthase component 1 [Leclercia adecarboxylata]|uniref:Anthranilate synthase component 1 n=1 Tax=Leclercia adecarboxylata TaxID=83655 RepID=A0A4U9HX11_9ENTR|nr:Anthranilate synthase component 1 [Leclercia adecarboxylata]